MPGSSYRLFEQLMNGNPFPLIGATIFSIGMMYLSMYIYRLFKKK